MPGLWSGIEKIYEDAQAKKKKNSVSSTANTWDSRYPAPVQTVTRPVKPTLEHYYSSPTEDEVTFIEPAPTTFTPSARKFAAKAAVTTASMAIDTVQFVSDYVARHASQDLARKALFLSNPVLSALSSTASSEKLLAESWKRAAKPNAVQVNGLEKINTAFDDVAARLQGIDYIQPSTKWKNATLTERFSKEHFGETLFNAGTDIVGSFAGYAINPTAGFALAAGSVAQSLKDTARENGVDEETSDRIAISSAILIGLFDKLVPGGIKKAFPVAFAKRLGNIVLRGFKTGAKEATTEVVQENIQMAAEVALRKDIGLDEFAARNIMSGFTGFLAGKGISILADSINTARDPRFRDAVDDIQFGFSTKEVVPSDSPLLSEAKKSPEDKYLYHGTSLNAFENIKKEGIKPQRRGLSSLSTSEDYSKNWAFPEATNTKGVMLRVKKDFLEGKTVDLGKQRPKTDEMYEILTKETIPPEAIEVFQDGKWQPLSTRSGDTLLSEAKKYKTAEEFVKSLNLTKQSKPNTELSSIQRQIDIKEFGKDGKILLAESESGVKTNSSAVSAWEKRITDGERPIVYVGGTFMRVVDGNNRLAAYKNLGFKEVPTVFESQLLEIYKKAHGGAQQQPMFLNGLRHDRLVTRKEAKERLSEYRDRLKLDNLQVQLVDEILTKNGTAFASFFGNTITFIEGLPQFAADHEVIHSLMQNMDRLDIYRSKGITRQIILDETRQRYGDIGDIKLEERVAENFELYVEARINQKSTTWLGKLADFFVEIYDTVSAMFSSKNASPTMDFFNWVYGGAQSAPVTLRKANMEKYTSINQYGDVVVDFSEIDKASFKEMSPAEYLHLQETLKERRAMFDASNDIGVLRAEVALNIEAQQAMNDAVVLGIKNNPHFKKEGEILDILGEGYLMKKATAKKDGKSTVRSVVVAASEKDAYALNGYKVGIEIDSLASANGFDSGFAYLENQLRLSKLETSEEKRIDNYIYDNDVVFKNTKNKLENYRGMIRGETVTVAKYMHDVGIMERTKDRRVRLSAVQKFFGLSDGEMKQVRGDRDISKMTSGEFEQYMYDLDVRAVEYEAIAQKKAELMSLVAERELTTFENLRQAMELPPISQMSIEQIDTFITALEPYQRGDAFLPMRKLQTIDNTKLLGMKTVREVREALAIESGVSPEELGSIKSTMGDYVAHDVALAAKNPLYEVIVNNATLNQVSADIEKIKILNVFFEKVTASRKSRNRKLSDRLIPQDKAIVLWLEANQNKKNGLERLMTPAELDLAVFMQSELVKIRDYLIKQQIIEHGIENYYMHIRRGFLETVKDDNLIKAFREMFKQNELDVATFKIIDDDTGTVLPLEKFFTPSLKRKGGLVPTQNVSRAFEQYITMFYKKIALDSIVPLIDIYVYSVEPKKATETGLQMDRSLRKFVNEWLNNKRGRTFSFGGALKQGGKLDSILRFGKAFTTFNDLGINIPAGVASSFGEHTMVFKGIGAQAQAIGVARFATKKGRDMVKKYEVLTGRDSLGELFSPSNDIGDKLLDGAMILFSVSSKIANNTYFLGSISQDEFDSGTVSVKRLAEMKLDIGRMRPVRDFKSIIGSTSVGQAGTQYKTWAIPVLTTTLSNWTTILRTLKSKKNPIGSRELREEMRGVLLVTLVYLLFAADDEDKSFAGKLTSKIRRELFTSVQALTPQVFAATPRLISFVEDMRDGIQSLIALETYKTKEGLKGIATLKRALTPKFIQQFQREATKKEAPTTWGPRKSGSKKPSSTGRTWESN